MGKRRMDSDLHRIKLDKGTVYQTSKGGNYYFRYQVSPILIRSFSSLNGTQKSIPFSVNASTAALE